MIVSNDVENSREPKVDPSSGSIDLTLGNDPELTSPDICVTTRPSISEAVGVESAFTDESPSPTAAGGPDDPEEALPPEQEARPIAHPAAVRTPTQCSIARRVTLVVALIAPLPHVTSRTTGIISSSLRPPTYPRSPPTRESYFLDLDSADGALCNESRGCSMAPIMRVLRPRGLSALLLHTYPYHLQERLKCHLLHDSC